MITRDPALLAAAAALRYEVFTVGQGVDPAVERDGADADGWHAVQVRDAAVVATGRLVAEGDGAAVGVGRIGRVAVHEQRRGERLGAAVMADLERAAAAAGLPRLRLHAQAPVTGFYRRLGWTPEGAADVEAGMPHQWMTKELLPGLRPVRDDDAAGLQALIGGCFAEYPGCVLELDGLDGWMRAPAAGYAAKRGQLWVLPGAGGLAASVGWAPAGAEAVELKSLYVASTARRRGYGRALVGLVERAARRAGAQRLVLWTDTRFADAHRLYESAGFTRQPGTRELHDLSGSVEYPYLKQL